MQRVWQGEGMAAPPLTPTVLVSGLRGFTQVLAWLVQVMKVL